MMDVECNCMEEGNLIQIGNCIYKIERVKPWYNRFGVEVSLRFIEKASD